ncbi:hypothetical protein GLIP_2424 [Aliiglaciecola lipolytica E3]|uniref:Uncharacterized protein n=1 Tax=Aliiglaciecola lipolytica E3 TaxID=1127673 RepID=K6YUU6_9ALTE|nr:hypothetical protein GLIP_2424 [Aliiglaciecola lipolytica E3]
MIPAPAIAPIQANGSNVGIISLANMIVNIDDIHKNQPNISSLLKYLVRKLGWLSDEGI